MLTVIVIARTDKYAFQKKYEVEDVRVVPVEGRSIWVLQRRLMLRVKHITQDLDNGIFEVFCDAGLEDLWALHISNAGWQIGNPQEFEADPAVKKAVAKAQARMARIQVQISQG